jgi:UDP-glucuronate decarboxylase
MMNHDSFRGPVNLGNPTEFSILEVANLIIKLADSDSEIIYHSLPPDDPAHRQPDISLAVEKLDWQPRTDLVEGLKKTIAYFRELIDQ